MPRSDRCPPARGHRGSCLRWTGTFAILLLLAVAVDALEVPFLSGRVNDQASLLDSAAVQRIEASLASLEAETGAQVVVLTIPSLDGEVLEDFSIRVVEQWKLGRAGVDDGVLLLVARDDRKLRIEVGYGLEGALPDVVARRIIDEIIVPEFRNGDFEGGIEAGVAALAGVVRGEELPPPPARSSGGGKGGGFDFVGAIIVGLFVMSGALSSAIRKKPMRALAVAMVGALLVGAGLALFLTMIWGILGAGAWLFFVLLMYLSPASMFRGGGRGGWISGGGRFGGGGGFSGGGGSFGGGGASGSW